MYDRLISYMLKNISFEYQFGFQKGKSTHMALITLVDRITEPLPNGDYVVGVFLDFSKAFDTVDHAILLDKMFMYGVWTTALQWFKDYFTGPSQYVAYNGFKSNNSEIKCGEVCFSILLTDVSNMFIPGKDVQVISEKLNSDMENIRQRLCCNKLSLNVSKTHCMVFSPKSKHVDDLNIKTKTKYKYQTKFLGVMIDAQLSWRCHIEYTCKNI